jgi:subtilase family serine protease
MAIRTWIRRLFAQRAATSRPAVRRQPRRAPLQLEALETRLAPTGNITLNGISIVDTNHNPLPAANIGQQVQVKATFTTQDLPSNASYRVSFMINGLTVYSSYITAGAGSGTNSWTAYGGLGYACPGTNQVTVVVDPDQSVAETTYADNSMSGTFNAVAPAVGAYVLTPAQMRAAYGVNSIPNFGAAAADGSGQTIAIVDPYNDPNLLSDLNTFDQEMSLTTTSSQTLFQQYGAASSFAHVYNQSGVDITANVGTSGQNGVPPADSTGASVGEESLDVQWAHAIAPGAQIDLIECNSGSGSDMLAGDKTAAGLPGVSAVSNSWSLPEWSGQTAVDSSTFVTPSGHTGVTFLASSGDAGANVYLGSSSPTQYYPATSPNVVAVGGTELNLNNNAYGGETGWSFPALASAVTNGSSSYAQTGTWTSQPGGFSGNLSSAVGGSASSASWTLAITSANEGWNHGTEVSATWPASYNNATSATYTIHDGSASGKVLGTVLVDQAKSPLGTADGNAQFQELGVFFPTLDQNGNGTLTVVLDASTANGTVFADAIGTAKDWASGGGPSNVELKPSYQQPFTFTGARSTPDVSLDAGTSVFVVANGNLSGAGGTSLSCPCWAGLIAIANQGRVANGATTFNSPSNPTQTLQALYGLPAADYNDITSGYNGFSAGNRYNFVTGLGSPVANTLIPDLTNCATQTAGLSGPSDGVLYQSRTFTFTANGSAGDNAAGYTYAINWGDGSPVQKVSATANNTTITLSHTYTQTGTFTVSATATDQFGYTAPAVSQAITVGVVAVEADPAGQGGITGLAISGVAGSSGVILTPTGSGDNVQVTRGGVLLGTFTAPGGVVAIYGDGGTDLVTLKGLSSSANTFTINGNTVTLAAAALPPSGFSVGLSGISNITLQGGSQANTFTFAGTSAWVPATIRGSGSANTVIGPDFNSIWDITAANAGYLFAPSWSFSGIQNLTGGSQGNDFIFSKGASLSGKLNGGGGGGTLDESAFTTAVTVNL